MKEELGHVDAEQQPAEVAGDGGNGGAAPGEPAAAPADAAPVATAAAAASGNGSGVTAAEPAPAPAPTGAAEPAKEPEKTGGEGEKKGKDADEARVGWIQENIEAVVVAIVLAVIIRHFAMEAFVIPTGSMAPTLNGIHVDATCDNCGNEFAVAFPEPNEAGVWQDFLDIGRPGVRAKVSCRACGRTERWSISKNDITDGMATVRCTGPDCDEMVRVDLDDPAAEAERVTILRPDCETCEHDFDMGVAPRDVQGGNKILVNKFIYKMRDPRRFEVMVFKNPADPQKTFIKRVMGLPGEMLRVRDGDVYVNGQIVRKPARVQEVLFMPVYRMNNVQTLSGKSPPWETFDELWDLSDPRRLIAGAPGEKRTSWIEFDRKIRDRYGYNSREQFSSGSGDNVVGDIRVSFTVKADGRGSSVYAALREDDREFTLHLRADPDGIAPSAVLIDGRAKTGTQMPKVILTPGKEHHVVFQNVDDLVRAWLDGEEVLFARADGGPGWEVANDPDKWSTDKSGVRLGVRGDGARFTDVEIDRDVYYTSSGSRHTDFDIDEDHFVVLGDNSPNSQDSRKWDSFGVPRSHIVGRAFMVFWPAFELEMIR